MIIKIKPRSNQSVRHQVLCRSTTGFNLCVQDNQRVVRVQASAQRTQLGFGLAVPLDQGRGLSARPHQTSQVADGLL